MNISTCQVYKINKINQSLKLLREKEMLTTEYPTKPNIERKKEKQNKTIKCYTLAKQLKYSNSEAIYE